jgi:hypothetical protein
MPLILSGNVASATASTGFNVDNSLRFNSADSAHLDLTDPPGNNYYSQFTWSFWVKRCKLGSEQYIVQSSLTADSNFTGISFNSSDQLAVQLYDSTCVLQLSMITNRLFRDVSAWYHIMVCFDLNDGTTADRLKIYVNGTRETSFATSTIPGAGFQSACFIDSADPLYIGRGRNPSGSTVYSDFYLAQFLCVTPDSGDSNGENSDAELIPTQVGEFNEDTPTVFQPIEIDAAVLGASLDMSDNLGTNGFFLDFADSANLGNDVNGGTDWDENNIDATDQATDTPTNNFATFNSLSKIDSGTRTFSEGNLYTAHSGSDSKFCSYSTIGVTSGKWYGEFKFAASSGGTDLEVGVGYDVEDANRLGKEFGYTDGTYGYNSYGNIHNDSNESSYGNTLAVGDIVGIALDLDNHKLYFSKNGTWQDSGDPESGATGTGSAFDLTTGETYFMGASHGTATTRTTDYAGNYGGCPAFTISSGNADGNGYGNFEYAPPSGYYALCTKNLAEYG